MDSISRSVKHIIAFVAILIISMILLPAVTRNAYAAEEVASGSCGEQVNWSLNDEGVFTISGTGNMNSYFNQARRRPWLNYINDIQHIVVNEGVTSLGDTSFFNCDSLLDVSLPNSLTSIGKEVFSNCDCLSTITIPDNVNYIGVAAFDSNKSLTSIVLPKALTVLSEQVLYGCSQLSSLEIPINVRIIEPSALSGCTSLSHIFIPKNVEDISSFSFDYNSTIEIDPDNAYLTMYESAIYTKDMSELIYLPWVENVRNFTVPTGVKKIRDSAIRGDFDNLIISDNVTSMEKHAVCAGTITHLYLSRNVDRYIASSVYNSTIDSLTINRGKSPICPAMTFDNCTIGTIHVPQGATGYDIAPWTQGTVIYDLDAITLEGISLNYPEITVSTEETIQLTALPIPEDATESFSVQWESNKDSVATVNANGLVNIISSGTAIITATTDAGSATCTITVPEAVMQTYDLTVTNGSGSGVYRNGKVVVIKENISDKYKMFTGWEVIGGNPVIDDVNASETYLTMSAENVEVKANYELTELGQAIADKEAALEAQATAEALLAQIQQELHTTQNTIASLNETIVSKDVTIEEKEAALTKANQNLIEANTALAKANQDLETANARLAAANNTITKLQETIAGKDEELEQASADFQTVKTQLAETQSALVTATTNYNNTKAELDEAVLLIADLRLQLATSQTDLHTAQEEKEKAEADLAAKEEELTAAKEAEAQAKAEAKAAKEAEETAKATASEAAQRVDELSQEKAELEERLENTNTAKQEIQAELDRVNAELETAKQEKADADKALAKAQVEKQQAIEARDAAVREKEEAEARAREIEAEIERLNDIINASSIKNATITGLKNVTYTGSEIAPAISVKLDDKDLKEGTDYTVYFVNNTNVGTATVLVTGEGNYDGVCKATFTIDKADNTLTAKGKTATIKYTKLKKKNQTVTVKNAFTVNNAQGKVTYEKTGGNAKIKVSSAGKIIVKKGLKKATYKITVQLTAAGNSNYEVGSKEATVTIRVK